MDRKRGAGPMHLISLYAAAELRGDREIVLAAVAQDGNALWYAEAELKGDREIVLAAVAQHGNALRYAAAELNCHRALQWIRTTNVALHCAKLRLALATCALPPPMSCSGGALSALPRDLSMGCESGSRQHCFNCRRSYLF